MTNLHLHLSLFLLCLTPSFSLYQPAYLDSPSQFVDMVYHMGPVLTSPINLYPIWYGQWNPNPQSIIRDFLLSLSSFSLPSPSVPEWWHTATQYTDQTNSNVTSFFNIISEHHDTNYSHGNSLTRLSIQSVINSAVTDYPNPLPLDPTNGVYLVLSSPEVQVQDFCRAVCGFHYFTFPSIVGTTVPYAWIGHSGTQCPGTCAYPFAAPPSGSGYQILGSPNGDIATDGMISVIAHELAEMATNPYINGWYAGDDPTAPNEIGDLCEGIYGTGGGGGFVGNVFKSSDGVGYNLNGVNGRKFLVQWIWDRVRQNCYGPNAVVN
ncbi:hypothetical protein LUZ60_010559 [Juncus effusus]|nr:hypothetical protein LUZ60_010559 [Juncus effusus]